MNHYRIIGGEPVRIDVAAERAAASDGLFLAPNGRRTGFNLFRRDTATRQIKLTFGVWEGEVVEAGVAPGPDTVREGPVLAVEADHVSETFTRRAMTEQEISAVPLPEPDPIRVALRLAGIDPDAPDEATVVETALPFADLVVGTLYPAGFLVDVGGTNYAVARDGFYYGAWSSASLISLGHLVLADVPAGPQPWVQPAGAHDAYAIGATVTHNGQTWVNTTASNVWEPGVFGWEVVV